MGLYDEQDEIFNRLVDRRPACASRNMYRSGDYDFVILLAFLAAVIVVFVLFFQYDFGHRNRPARTPAPPSSAAPTEAVQNARVHEEVQKNLVGPAVVAPPEEIAAAEHVITAEFTDVPVTFMAPQSTQTTQAIRQTTAFTICDDPGCREMADELQSSLDYSVSPCSDFYQHVCGRWLRTHVPELGEALVSEQTLRQRRLERELLAELRAGTDDSSMRWPLRLWRSCSATSGEPHSHDVLRTILASHGLAGFPFGASYHGKDVAATAAKVLAYSALPALVDIKIVKRPVDLVPTPTLGAREPRPAPAPGRWMIRVGPPEPLFRGFVRMRNVHDEWFMAVVEKVSGLRDMPELIKIEQALVDLAGERTGVDDYVPATVMQLRNSRHWNWTTFLRTALRGVTGVGARTPVLVKGRPFQRRFTEMVEKFGSPSLHNYLALRMYVRYSLFLDWKHYREAVDVAAARFPGWEDREPPTYAAELRCLRFLSRLMPEPFVYVHWNTHLRNLHHLEEALGAMTEHVVDEAVNRVRALNVTPRLTSLFRDVVFGLKNQLLAPAWMRTPSLRMKFSKLAFAEAEASPMVTWNGVLRALQLNTFRKLVDRGFETFWHGPALGFEPWLDWDEGYLAVPPAAVKRIFTERAFSVHHLPRIGLDLARAVVEHFLQMAFRFKRKYPTAHLKLELLGDCLRRQFYGNRPASDVAARHDVVDVLALPAVLRAFRERAPTQAKHKSSPLSGEAPSDSNAADRLFFYEFARGRCEAYDDAYLHQRMHHGTRSPAPFSVNGPLRNLEQFAEAFDCPRGSDMRPNNFCTI